MPSPARRSKAPLTQRRGNGLRGPSSGVVRVTEVQLPEGVAFPVQSATMGRTGEAQRSPGTAHLISDRIAVLCAVPMGASWITRREPTSPGI